MDIQSQTMAGDFQSMQMEMTKQQSLMDSYATAQQQGAAQGETASEGLWGSVAGGVSNLAGLGKSIFG
jgi:uncharacterized protein (DUF2342 family)